MTLEQRIDLREIYEDLPKVAHDCYEEPCCAGCYQLVDYGGELPTSEDAGKISHQPTCPLVRLERLLAEVLTEEEVTKEFGDYLFLLAQELKRAGVSLAVVGDAMRAAEQTQKSRWRS